VSLLMLPIVDPLLRSGAASGPEQPARGRARSRCPRWRVVTRVVLPTSLSGLITGSLLAVARGMGETAPLLFTVSSAFVLTGNLGAQMTPLPVQISRH